MNEEELIQETRKLIGRWDNIRIVGQGWAGDTRRGFEFNPTRTIPVGGGTTPVIPTGACCPEEGDCFISTQSVCEGGGGTYQGDDTTCDPDPCPPPTPTGACCVGTDCTIETEDDCTGMGGTYQGDDTVCDPNPCEMPPCGSCINVFEHDGRFFLTKAVHFTFSNSATLPPPNGDCTASCDISSIVTIDPDTCVETSVCSGTGIIMDDTGSFPLTWGGPVGGHCEWNELGNSQLPLGGLICETCHDIPGGNCPPTGFLEEFTDDCDYNCMSVSEVTSVRVEYSDECTP